MASARAIDRVSTLLLLTDIVAILLACAIVPVSGLATLLLIVVVVVAFQGNTLYRSRLTLSLFDELPVLLAGVAAAVGVSALVTISTDGRPALADGLPGPAGARLRAGRPGPAPTGSCG